MSVKLGIETGYQSAAEKQCVYLQTTVALTTKALNELRGSDGDAIDTLDTLLISAALFALEECKDMNPSPLEIVKQLIIYRTRYRTNSAEWTPAEEHLERILQER